MDNSLRSQKIWAWGGIVSVVAFAIGWCLLARFLPPLHPSDSPQAIAHIFEQRRNGIRMGALVMIIGTCLWVPWSAAVAGQIWDAEPGRPTNAWVQVGSAAVGTTLICFAMLTFVVAAFRPDRNPDVTQALSDLGFIVAVMPFMVFVVWNLALAVAILDDPHDEPAFPRWSAYLCAWCALLYVPGGAVAFFHRGPFAWNGLVGFYVPGVAFFLWVIVMTVLTLRSVDRRMRAAGVAESDRRSASLGH